MGKKSKRPISSTTTTNNKTNSKNGDEPGNKLKSPKSKERRMDEEVETKDNLRFEDPFEDEFEEVEEEEAEEENETGMEEEEDNDGNSSNKMQSWNPLTHEPLASDQRLEIDETAYKMHHSLTPEWPSLSFDFLQDSLGHNRTRFPHSLIAAVGSQADRKDRNRLTIVKMSDLGRSAGAKTEKEMEDDLLGEEFDKNAEEDIEEDSDEEEEEEENDDVYDLDPVLEHFNLNHTGGVNRVRAMPQNPEVVATWSDEGIVNLFDVGPILEMFEKSSSSTTLTADKDKPSSKKTRKIKKDPFFVYSGHSTEGYALDWSRTKMGQLATGDCAGHIHIWDPMHDLSTSTTTKSSNHSSIWNNSTFRVENVYAPTNGDNIDNPSIEDLQWSPTEGTVLAAAECGGYVRIYDTRCKGKPMLSKKVHENSADVNVMSWNPIVSNLLATGGDDGAFTVWDLRNFQSTPNQPLARFTCHRQPITSLEWHPTDESMIVVSDEDGTYVYDLSIEEDEDQAEYNQNRSEDDPYGDIPPQLLFVHCGSQSTKEVHWHPQVTSLIMTTALSGYSVFIPSNL
eukprot:CAMPEP_0184855052 /NCGR_PEP_ID=MMETSP0580-20130426/385_1 /TAXON_ID=1118495 /ORGANISM="Dactyliosolen fragilissimus" /LENGTH=565 /DNA_ID=CAMNT_0027349467 /DNA_START=54 /DNA_END=1751 /DNA_ORIENTATION=+